jgi:hypothetical protein
MALDDTSIEAEALAEPEAHHEHLHPNAVAIGVVRKYSHCATIHN